MKKLMKPMFEIDGNNNETVTFDFNVGDTFHVTLSRKLDLIIPAERAMQWHLRNQTNMSIRGNGRLNKNGTAVELENTWNYESLGTGVKKVAEMDFNCTSPGQTVLNFVFGNGMDLFLAKNKHKAADAF